MEKSTKIALGVSITAILITAAVIFRKRIKSTINKGSVSKSASKLALSEWKHWAKGSIKEGNSSTMKRLTDYWVQGGGVNWDAKKMTDEAWSAAFISYLMKKSGAGNNFKYSISHSEYIRDAVKNRKEGNNKTFRAFRPQEVKIEVGDLVCYPRQSGVSFDKTGSYMSHCDIVTTVNKLEALSIGGNISDSVSQTKLPLNSKGFIDKSKDGKSYGGYFAVIKNLSK